MTSISSTYQPETLQSLAQRKGRVMGEYPDTDTILATWWTLAETTKAMKITRQAVVDACHRGIEQPDHPQTLRGRQIAGRWFIDPESVKRYQYRYEK